MCDDRRVHLQSEYVVLLNEMAEPIGNRLKATVHNRTTPLHLAFSIFLFDGKGRTLFQRRAWHKPTWSGVWSNACCGHPMPGESLSEAARRRLHQELGIAEPGPLELVLPDFRYRACWREIWENEVCPVFMGRYAGPVRANLEEVADTRWIDWSAFVEACRHRDAEAWTEFSPWSQWEALALAACGHPLVAPSPAVAV